jgi:hypothetical protein
MAFPNYWHFFLTKKTGGKIAVLVCHLKLRGNLAALVCPVL